ncbi:MAG: hypothetical protein HQK51_04905 [Oligoflexia bacterium]|nr:hypothetical protein [Oligoflexia bacterium]
MNIVKIIIIVITFIITISRENLMANDKYHHAVNKLTSNIKDQIKNLASTLEENSSNEIITTPIRNPEKNEIFFLNTIFTRFTTEISIKIPLISLRISPNFGLIWIKKNPQGWKPYSQ